MFKKKRKKINKLCYTHKIKYFSPVKSNNVLNNTDQSHRYYNKHKRVHMILYYSIYIKLMEKKTNVRYKKY